MPGIVGDQVASSVMRADGSHNFTGHWKSNQTTAPSVSAGEGAWYVKSDGLPYFKSPEAGEVSLSASGGLNVTGDLVITTGRVMQGKGADTASASNILTLGDGNIFAVTSSEVVNTITTTGWNAGSLIILQASNASGFSLSNSAGNVRLSAGADLSLAQNQSVILWFDGTNWRQPV